MSVKGSAYLLGSLINDTIESQRMKGLRRNDDAMKN